MPTCYRECPPALATALAGAKSFHEIAWQIGPENSVPVSTRIQIFGGFLTIVFEHHDSTVILLETGRNDASAFALARLLVEAFYSGLWLLGCASDAEVEEVRIGSRQPYPPFVDMTKTVDRALGNTGKLEMEGTLWAALCGFTHSGAEQLSRRFDGGS